MNEINMAPHSTSTFLIQFVYQENVWSKQLYLLLFIYSIYIYIYIGANVNHTKAVARRSSVKMVLQTIYQNSQENAYFGISFLMKLQASGLPLYQKRNSNTGVFL